MCGGGGGGESGEVCVCVMCVEREYYSQVGKTILCTMQLLGILNTVTTKDINFHFQAIYLMCHIDGDEHNVVVEREGASLEAGGPEHE